MKNKLERMDVIPAQGKSPDASSRRRVDDWRAGGWRPVWDVKGGMRREPILLVKKEGSQQLTASLLYKPARLLKVTTAGGETLPSELFVCDRAQIHAMADAALPWLAEKELFPATATERSIERHADGQRYLLFSEGHYFHDLQLFVDYETDDQWTGPIPASQADRLPRFSKRLATGQGVAVVLLGDSISRGANASGVVRVPPFQPAYGDLAVEAISKRYGVDVRFGNLSKGGMNSLWGLEQAESVCECNPDLVIIAFGMNDASDHLGVETFHENIKQLMARVRGKVPEAEFVLVSGMSPHKAWNLAKPELREAMHDALHSLAGMGVVVCDVRSVWAELVRRKGFMSLTGNGVNHPNDFGHRVYAGCLVHTLMQ